MQQVTFLLFLKMADELALLPFNKPSPIPKSADRSSLLAQVARRLSVVEELESVVEANLRRAKNLRQAILQKAFAGELV